jgi:hypothetical protein
MYVGIVKWPCVILPIELFAHRKETYDDAISMQAEMQYLPFYAPTIET